VTLGVAEVLARTSRHSGFRYVVVGAASVAVDAGTLYLLHGRAGLWLPVATALAFVAAFGVNFGLNRAWSFDGVRPLGRQLSRYFALVALNLPATVLAVQALTWLGLPYLVAKLVTAAVLAVVNYLVSRRWVF